MTKLNKGSLFIIIAAILWGLDGILRRSLFELSPITIVFFEHLIGAIIILPFFLPQLKKEKLTRKEWGALAWVSFFSGLMGTLWFTTALIKTNFISFSVVFLLQKLQPIFAIITAKLLLREKLSKKYVQWAALALIAAYFVTFKNGIINFDTGDQTIIAALLATGAAFAWGSSTAISRFTLINHSHTLISGLRFTLVTVITFIALTLTSKGQLFQQLPSQTQFLTLILIAFSTGLVALWLYYKGLKQTPAQVSTILELVFPLTAVIIDIFLYKTVLSPSQYLAAFILLFAVYKVGQETNLSNVSNIAKK